MTRFSMTRFLTCAGVAGLTAAASAQTAPLRFHTQPVEISSETLANPTDGAQLVFDEIVEGQGAPWMRLRFDDVALAPGSYLIISSLLDGKFQYLDARSAAEWYNHSAYFNGDAVQVSLYAAPNSEGNRLTIGELILGEWEVSNGGISSQCGSTDDRIASTEPERARLLNVGCTASLFSEDNCFVSAGHCVQSGANTVEFNVPASLPSGTIVHPGPEDQYSVDSASREFVNGGVGNDWGLFKVFNNSTTGLTPFQAQGAHLTIASAMPALPETIDLVGYGIDSGSANQTQQRSTGPVTSITGTTLNHQSDTEGGNSGSSIRGENGEVIAIHTHAGCNTQGTGSNASTAITNSGFQAALADFCGDGGGGDPIPCSDITGFNASCRRGGRVKANVTVSSVHNGKTVTIEIDGTPFTVTIANGKANLNQSGYGAGSHTVELVDPPGCRSAITVTCN